MPAGDPVSDDVPPRATGRDEHRSPVPSWTGVGIAIGAGIGMTVGVLAGGGAALATGLAIGAGLGVAIGAAVDSRRRPG